MRLTFAHAFVFVSLLASSLTARADCPALASLEDEGDGCQSNGKYVDAGISCFTGLEKLVKEKAGAATSQLGAANAKSVGGAKNSQQSGLAGSADDYQISAATLTELLEAAKAARASLLGYGQNIYFPDDFDAPASVIGNANDYINRSPCYAEPRDMLRDLSQRTDKIIADLEHARSASLKMKSTSGSRDQQLSNGGGAAAARTRALGAKAVPKGPSKNSSSTITGVEEDKKKSKEPGQ